MEALRARPVQAAVASAISFAVGAIVPIAAVLLAPSAWVTEVSSATALLTWSFWAEPLHTLVARLLSGVQCEFPFGEHSQWGSPRALESSSARLYR